MIVFKELARLGIVGMIWLYRILLSPLLGGECRFSPTCSEYSLEALRQLPVKRAVVRIARRLLSCHPFHPVGGI